MKKNIKHKQNFKGILLIIVVFITTISQLPKFVDLKITNLIAIPVWAIAAFVFLPHIKINKKLILLFAGFLFITIYIIIISVITSREYYNIRIIYPFYLSIFIFFIGYSASRKLNLGSLYKLMYAILFAVILISVNIYTSYFMHGFDIMSRSYAYTAKNSIAQIILTGLIIIIFIIKPNRLIYKLSKLIIICFLLLIIFFLKSRATIIALPLLILIPFIYGKSQIKLKVIVLVLSTILISFIFLNNDIYNLFFRGVLAAGRDVNDLNSVSSGRYQQFINFPKYINGHEFLGIGKFKIESFPLSVILQFGIPLGLIFISIAGWPLYWGIKNLNKKEPISIAFLIISSSYFLNGFFEELAPFGPGVKNFTLWLLFGILYTKNRKLRNTLKTGQYEKIEF